MGVGLDPALPAKTTNFAQKTDLASSFYFPECHRLDYPDLYRWYQLPFLGKNLANQKLIRKMLSNRWNEALLRDDIDGFLAFDNFLLWRKVFRRVKEVYDGENLQRPFTMLWNASTAHMHEFEGQILDKVFLSGPLEKFTYRNFELPSQAIGYQGLYDAFEFLLKQDPEFADLVLPDRLYVPVQVIRTITDEMVFRLRSKQRELMHLGGPDQIRPTCVSSFLRGTRSRKSKRASRWPARPWSSWWTSSRGCRRTRRRTSR